MATAALNRDVVLAIAEEVANGVQTAVDCWMTEIDMALSDTRLTTLGRLNAVREIVENYKHLTGQVRLDCRTLPRSAPPRDCYERRVSLPDCFELDLPPGLDCHAAGGVCAGLSGRFGLSASSSTTDS